MNDEAVRIPELFFKTVMLGIALGWNNISARPGCTEYQLDEHWWFAINPHAEDAESSCGTVIPAHAIYFKFNGWPFGVCTASGGACGAGTLANEHELVRVIESKIQELKTKEQAKVN